MVGTVTLASKPGQTNQRHSIGDLWLVRGSYAGPASYTTGGDPVAAADFGMPGHTLLEVIALDTVTGTEYSVFDAANSKIKLFTADGTEVANAANASTQAYRFIALIA